MSNLRHSSKLLRQFEKYSKSGILPVVAVSGGIDSLTLAVAFSSYANHKLAVAHAVGPAVPDEATKRVNEFSLKFNWKLFLINAGEMQDPRYIENPFNRCFFCKQNLYTTIFATTKGTIVSGANLDDLNDYRPGLKAALDANVAHPFIDAHMGKKDIRKLAIDLGLGELSVLPSSPCLSSRVETGIKINSSLLKKIGKVESKIRQIIAGADLRCRWFSTGVEIEFKYPHLDKITRENRRIIYELVANIFSISEAKVKIGEYQRGNSFIKPQHGIK